MFSSSLLSYSLPRTKITGPSSPLWSSLPPTTKTLPNPQALANSKAWEDSLNSNLTLPSNSSSPLSKTPLISTSETKLLRSPRCHHQWFSQREVMSSSTVSLLSEGKGQVLPDCKLWWTIKTELRKFLSRYPRKHLLRPERRKSSQ